MKTELGKNEILDGEISLDNLDALFDKVPVEETTLEKEIIEDLDKDLKPNNDEIVEEAITVDKEKEEKEEEVIIDTELEKSKVQKESNVIFERAKSLIELGIIEDVRVSVNDEDENGTLLSEFKDLNESQLKEIVSIQQEKRDSDLKENYIKKEGIPEDNLKIINILKNGGDITEIFSSPQQMQRPFQGLDLEDEKTQKQIILHHFINNSGNSQKEALALLKQKEEDFEIDSFSKKIVDAYNTKFDEFITAKENETRQIAAEKRQKIADIRKNLSKTLKENKIKDSISRKIIDGVTKQISKNRVQVHEVIDKILENPQDNHEILLHLLDPKAFSDLYKVKQKSKEAESFIKLIGALPKDKAKKLEQNKKEDTLSDFERELTSITIE